MSRARVLVPFRGGASPSGGGGGGGSSGALVTTGWIDMPATDTADELVAANTLRGGLALFNDTDGDVSVLLDDTTAPHPTVSATDRSFVLVPGAYYVLDYHYEGAVDYVCEVGAAGVVQVNEFETAA